MARTLHRLSALTIKAAEPGKYNDGSGLWLHKRGEHSGKWFLRISVHGRRREMGLGGWPEVSLKEARQEAEKWRSVSRQGEDPIKVRERQKREAMRNLHCLADIARDAFESRKAELKDDGKAGRWMSPLELHVLPKLGGVPVAEINQIDIRDTLKPIWDKKADTARKAMNRLSICLRHAAALGLDVDLQATEKARQLLGKQRHTAKHIPAMPWQDVPEFYASLAEPTTTHLALRFLILTGMRSKPVRFLHLDQIADETWTVPGALMKGRQGQTTDFRVPLSSEALAVIKLARPFERDGFLFPSSKKGVISDMTMSNLMKRRGLEARPHGFRSSLRDWLEEHASARYEVAETCLGHVVGGSVERAYRRTDYLEERREIMEAWGRHISGPRFRIVEGAA